MSIPINRGRTDPPPEVAPRSNTSHALAAPVHSVAMGPGNTYNASSSIRALYYSYAPLAYSLPWEVLDYVEVLATYNADYSQAVDNICTLANSGHELIVDAGGTREIAATRDYLQQVSRQVQPDSGGIDGVLDKLLHQAATYGAMAGEWLLDGETDEVIDFEDVNPKSIRFFWDDALQDYAPYQKVSGTAAQRARDRGQLVLGGCIQLNPITFHYYGFNNAPGSPYGVPPFIAALEPIGIQRDMVANMSQIVKKIGLLGLIDIIVKELPPKPGETDEAFAARASAYLDEYVAAGEDMVRDGGLVHYDDVTVESKTIAGNAAGATNIFKQNEELVFSGLKSMPSVQGRSYCVVPETKVLTADLRWVPAGELELGDELVGFDEHLGKGQGRGNVAKLRGSTVEVNRRIDLECVRVTMSNGQTITVSKQHPLVQLKRTEGRVWTEAADLRIGDRLSWFGAPWDDERSFEGGYIAGMFDGEGTMGGGYDGIRKTASLRIAQLDGPVMDATEAALKELGYKTKTSWKQQDNGKSMGVLSVLGGRYETMRLIGTLQPNRFMPRSRELWEGAMLRNSGTSAVKHHDYVTVTAIEDVGELEVVALQTSSRTFIAEGVLNHNSTTETYAGVAYDIIIRNTKRYQRACKRMIESGYWLAAQMVGRNPSSIGLDFHPNKTLNRLQDAQAEGLEIKNSGLKWAAGVIDQRGFAQELGYDDVKVEMTDPPDAIIGTRAPTSTTDSSQTGNTGGGKPDNQNNNQGGND